LLNSLKLELTEVDSALRSVEEVREEIISHVIPTDRSELRSVEFALGQIVAEDTVADVDVPPADNSAMDGFALDTEDPDIRLGGSYRVSDRIPAGRVGQPLVPGTLARIFTGANVPTGANAILIQENATLEDGNIIIDVLPEPGAWIRPQGQDLRKGGVAVPRGTRIRPQEQGLLTSVGKTHVQVYCPLTVALFSTGDELRDPPDTLNPGQIYNANRATLKGLLTKLGVKIVDLGCVPDDLKATEWALGKAAQSADCIITSGGVSVGEEDYVKQAVSNRGKLESWKVAMKPGKPVAFGHVDNTPFFGLPGNPVSTFVSYLLFVRPFLLKQQGATEYMPEYYLAPAGFNIQGGSRREYLRVKREVAEDGTLLLRQFANQSSGVLSSVSWADGLAEIEIGAQVEDGNLIKIYPFP